MKQLSSNIHNSILKLYVGTVRLPPGGNEPEYLASIGVGVKLSSPQSHKRYNNYKIRRFLKWPLSDISHLCIQIMFVCTNVCENVETIRNLIVSFW